MSITDPISKPDPIREHQCSAHSKASGLRCRQLAIAGGTVCHYHGGGAPQVKAAAMERILAMVDPALVRLAKLVEFGETDDVKYRAVRDILDRAGLAATAKTAVELTGKDGNAIEISARDTLAGRIAGITARISAARDPEPDDGTGSAGGAL